MAGEFDFINWVRWQQKPTALVPLPVGDDLAGVAWPAGELLLVGVDQVLDGVHFDSAIHSPRDIGRKVMNRNLSDCAAMACLPVAAVTTAALPIGCGLDYAKELYLGMHAAAEVFGCVIVGGDTGSWPGKLVLTVTIMGHEGGVGPVQRSGAKPGDGIYVTGLLGGSILGRHMTFTPRVDAGRLAAARGATAMIDLSDGLSRDLPHICSHSGVGAVIDATRVPIHSDAIELSRRDGHTPLLHALHDGEDYELLFTAPGDASGFADIAVRIGEIVQDAGVWLDLDGGRMPLVNKAWEHQL